MSTVATAEPLPFRIELKLTITDAEVIRDVSAIADEERDAHVNAALKIGLIALRQANTVIDADTVRKEGQHLLEALSGALAHHAATATGELSQLLSAYFDPKTGNLTNRLERLVAGDGDLTVLLRQHLGSEDSTLARSLAAHLGENSPLLRILSPDEKGGLVDSLASTIQASVDEQRRAILTEFSLDNESSALRRLVGQITDSNGKLKRDLAEDVKAITSEFSLDNESGALARLVKRVEAANATIASQLSLDNGDSALSRLSARVGQAENEIRANLTLDDENSSMARLRRELLAVVERAERSSGEFQTTISAQVATLTARKDRAARSTTHGTEYEEALGGLLQSICGASGDLYDDTRAKVGKIQRCKVGDHLMTLGETSATPDVKIVFEAKDRAGYSLGDALKELDEARENRAAEFGVFVFSPEAAPAGLDTMMRRGSDLIVTWSRDDVASDVVIRAAIAVCRALAIKQCEAAGELDADALESTIRDITKQAAKLGSVMTWAATITTNGGKIRDTAEEMKEGLLESIEELEQHLTAVKEVAGAAE